MIFILLSILASSVLFVIFKLFSIYKVNTLQAIIFNYVVACTCGIIAYQKPVSIPEIIAFDWFVYAAALGFIFISVFNFMAITTIKNGLSVVAVSSKMSVIFPVIAGVFLYQESLGWIKIVGILIALISVYLVTVNPKKIKKQGSLLFPILVFIGSGIIDTSVKYIQDTFVKDADIPIFSATLFGVAGCMGIIIFIYQLGTKKFNFQLKNLIGGVVLGIANYFSVYYLIKAISFKGWESATTFVVNNIGILLVTTFLGVLLFKEKLTTNNKIGVFLAAVGIAVVSFAEHF